MLLLVCAAAGGCSGPQSALDPAADQARIIGSVWHLMLVVCGVMYALTMVFLAWAIWRAWHAGKAGVQDDRPERQHVLRVLLVSWSVLIVAGLFVLAGGSFLADRALARDHDPHALQVRITGSEWWWQVEYLSPTPQEQFITANELHLPVDRPVEIELRSNDVIHSFWVPNLAGKTDLIPGRSSYLAVTPRRVAALRGQCAEFCGLEHARMALDVQVHDGASFDAWLRAQRTPAREPVSQQEVRGRQVFLRTSCATCHAIVGTDAAGRNGPDLTHLASRSTIAAGALPLGPQTLATWISDPHAVKPGTHMPPTRLAPEDLAALVAYLESLR